MQRGLVITMNKQVEAYLEKFGDLPPLFIMMTYEHPVYRNLIRIALDTNEPITPDMVEKEMKRQDVKCDM